MPNVTRPPLRLRTQPQSDTASDKTEPDAAKAPERAWPSPKLRHTDTTTAYKPEPLRLRQTDTTPAFKPEKPRQTDATPALKPEPEAASSTDDASKTVAHGAGKLVGARSAMAILSATTSRVVTMADWGGTAADTGVKLLEHPEYGKIAGRLLGSIDTDKVVRTFERLTEHAEKVGLAAAGVAAALNSNTRRLVWRAGEGVSVTAGTKVMVGGLGEASVAGVSLGPLVLVDMGMNYLGAKVIGEAAHTAAGGYISGHVVYTPAKLAAAYAEAIFSGDDRALLQFADDAKAGNLGVVYQAAVEQGEKLSGTLGDAIEATVDVFHRTMRFFGVSR